MLDKGHTTFDFFWLDFIRIRPIYRLPIKSANMSLSRTVFMFAYMSCYENRINNAEKMSIYVLKIIAFSYIIDIIIYCMSYL